MAGKGSKRRKGENTAKFVKNYDDINWGGNKTRTSPTNTETFSITDNQFEIEPRSESINSADLSKYTIEPHGKGYAIYRGRTHLTHGYNLAHLSECTEAFVKFLEEKLNNP